MYSWGSLGKLVMVGGVPQEVLESDPWGVRVH